MGRVKWMEADEAPKNRREFKRDVQNSYAQDRESVEPLISRRLATNSRT